MVGCQGTGTNTESAFPPNLIDSLIECLASYSRANASKLDCSLLSYVFFSSLSFLAKCASIGACPHRRTNEICKRSLVGHKQATKYTRKANAAYRKVNQRSKVMVVGGKEKKRGKGSTGERSCALREKRKKDRK